MEKDKMAPYAIADEHGEITRVVGAEVLKSIKEQSVYVNPMKASQIGNSLRAGERVTLDILTESE